MASKEDIKLNLERLRIENEIAKVQERYTKGIKDWREGQKKIADNAKLIAKYNDDILNLEKLITAEKKKGAAMDKEAVKAAEKYKAELEQSRVQLISHNRELASSVSFLKAAGNQLIKGFTSLLPSLREIISLMSGMEQSALDTARTLGLSGSGLEAMKQSVYGAEESMVKWYGSIGDGAKLMQSFNEETGRAVILSDQASEAMAMTAFMTGLSAEEMGSLAGEMEAFGLGSQQSAGMIREIHKESELMGVNAGKVIKKFQSNLGMLNKMNFKGGVKSLGKLAMHSEKFKLSMEAVASVTELGFNMEKAVEASARLQTLGGAMSQLGDPFQLMYNARNAPEELAKSLTKAAQESATFNKTTGEFEMSAHELHRLRESADALGMDYQELVQTAKQAAKVDYLGQFLGDIPKEQRGIFEGMTEMTKDGATISFVDEDGVMQTKLLGDLKKSEKENILKRAKEDEERAKAYAGTEKQFQKLLMSLKLLAVNALMPLMEKLTKSGVLDKIGDVIIDFAKKVRTEWWPQIKKFGRLLMSIFSPKGLFITALTLLLLRTFPGLLTGLFKLIFSAGGAVGKFLKNKFSSGGTGGGSNVKTPVKGKPGGPLKSLASGLEKMGNPKVLFGALNLIPTAIGMVALVPAIPTLAFLGTMKLKSLYKNLSAIGRGLTQMGTPQAALGAGVLLLSSIAFAAMTFGVIGLAAIALGGEAAGIGLIGLASGLVALGNPGTAAFAAIGVAILIGVGAAMMMMGAAIYFVAAGIALIITSFVDLFSVVNISNIGAIMLLGPALMLASLGIISLAGAIVIMGLALANPFGLLGLIGLAAAAYSLGDAMKGVDPDGITKAVNAVNSVNTENIEALKSLSMWLGMMGNNIKIEFGEIKVDGEIDLIGQNGAEAKSDLLNDKEFIRELNQIIAEHTGANKKGYQ